MIALIQRVTEASVEVAGQTVGQINRGVLALIAVQPNDTPRNVDRMTARLLGYRIFPDEAGRMNRSVTDTGGGLLLVPQFTLAADTGKGMRPSFTGAAAPALAAELFGNLVEATRACHAHVATGVFGADMQVKLVNDGPVTFLLSA